MTSPFAVRLDAFEGPLDLLLHLIRKHEMDIYDIQIAEIADQYLGILDDMKSLNLDVAGEFLVMAATLLQIKSAMLLPNPEIENEEESEEADPRAELVARLLEYQKYKEASLELDDKALLGRDVFTREEGVPPELRDSEVAFVEVGIFDLVSALQALLKDARPETVHEITQNTFSVSDRINHILDELTSKSSVAFKDLFLGSTDRSLVVATFLAVLELVKMRTVKVMQNSRQGTIWLFPAVPVDELTPHELEDGQFGYE
ncbi:MAG: segregation/condensation protein A [Desulfuromonas sp.]|nr:MAG: segregation/condensation protein A [Desulfuromonas sp.]